MDKNEILNLIKDLVEKTNVGEVKVSLEDSIIKGKNENLWFSILLGDATPYLGRDGEGLSALNHLVKKIIETKHIKDGEVKEIDLLIDINGHQKKKIEAIHAVRAQLHARSRSRFLRFLAAREPCVCCRPWHVSE